jgi:hypothetical protein
MHCYLLFFYEVLRSTTSFTARHLEKSVVFSSL